VSNQKVTHNAPVDNKPENGCVACSFLDSLDGDQYGLMLWMAVDGGLRSGLLVGHCCECGEALGLCAEHS